MRLRTAAPAGVAEFIDYRRKITKDSDDLRDRQACGSTTAEPPTEESAASTAKRATESEGAGAFGGRW